MKNATPAIANEIMKASMLAPVKEPERKKPNGTIGFSTLVSTNTNATPSTAAATNAVRINVSPQPRLPASMSPQVNDAIAAVTRSVPGMSVEAVPDSSRDSRTTADVTKNAMIPTGTLIRKTHSHDAYSTRSPPTTGPNAIPETEIAPQMPTARPRSSGGNAADISESDNGMMNAAPS